MTTLNNDELREIMAKACWHFSDTHGYEDIHDSARLAEFLDELTAYIATHDQQLLEAILEGAENHLSVASTNPKRVYSMKPHKAVPVEHIKSVFKKEGE